MGKPIATILALVLVLAACQPQPVETATGTEYQLDTGGSAAGILTPCVFLLVFCQRQSGQSLATLCCYRQPGRKAGSKLLGIGWQSGYFSLLY